MPTLVRRRRRRGRSVCDLTKVLLGVARFGRLAAQLHWAWEQTANAVGYLVSCNYQHVILRCRPEPDRDAKGDIFNKERPPPTHRYESTALPSFFVPDLPPIKTVL